MALRGNAGVLALCAALLLPVLTPTPPPAYAGDTTPAADASARGVEKDAFDSAKELGTVDAWNAFLASYPTGFHADLARAYLKKLSAGDQPPAQTQTESQAETPTPQLPPSSARAGERSCAERDELASEHSREPTKITFVNKSGMYRAIMWIGFDGKLQDYGGLNSGDQVTHDTFRTHPWMIATGPGDCLQIFMPAAEPATVELLRLAADDGPKKAPAKEKPVEKKVEKKPLVCAKNYKLQNGKCVLLQNCGKNAYRSPEGDCYCNKGYLMKGGKCTWPHDKNGYEISPEKKPGCKTWQKKCSQGNGNACGQYEANCQVN
jgi:hypothetical protein